MMAPVVGSGCWPAWMAMVPIPRPAVLFPSFISRNACDGWRFTARAAADLRLRGGKILLRRTVEQRRETTSNPVPLLRQTAPGGGNFGRSTNSIELRPRGAPPPAPPRSFLTERGELRVCFGGFRARG